jgi:coenzyme Q-binding protein COQ10
MYTIDLKTRVDMEPKKFFSIWRRPPVLLKSAPGIKQLRVIRRAKGSVITQWKVDIGGFPLEWQERDVLDAARGCITFNMTKGELQRYEGQWRVERTPDGATTLRLHVEIDWGLNVLAPHVEKTLAKKTRVLFKSFLSGIRKAACNNI